MGYCCITFSDDGTKGCFPNFSRSACENFPRGVGIYYETESQCYSGCGLAPPGGGGGGSEETSCFDFVPRSQCSGNFFPGTLCSSDPCITDPGPGASGGGLCCKDGTCITSANTEAACRAACGNWLSTFSYNFRSANNQYPGQRVTYQIGSDPNDCALCALGRPFFDFVDSGSCWPNPRWRRVSLSDLNYSNNPATNNKCCNYVTPDGSFACSDLLFNQFGQELTLESTVSNTPREGLIELLSCPLTEEAKISLYNLTDAVVQEWADLGYNPQRPISCPGQCCKCVEGSTIPQCRTAVAVGNLCLSAEICPEGYVYGVPDCDGGPIIIGGGTDGGVDPGDFPNYACLDNYCLLNPAYFCPDCPVSSLDSTVKSVKMYLNSTDFVCVDVACGECAGYELCEEN